MENQPFSSLVNEEAIKDAITWINHLSPSDLPVISVIVSGIIYQSTSLFESTTIASFLLSIAANVSVFQIPRELAIINEENRGSQQTNQVIENLAQRVAQLEQFLRFRK